MLIPGAVDLIFKKNQMVLQINDQEHTIKPMTLTSHSVSHMLKQYPFTGSGRIKDESIERAFVPIVASVFMRFVFDHDRIPTENDLWSNYVSTYLTPDGNGYRISTQYRPPHVADQWLSKEGLQARVLRAYPSLIRDVHFYLLCSELGGFDEVVYSLKTDLYDGLDLIIHNDGKLFGVSCFTRTARSQAYKQKKYARHDYSNLNEITLEIDLNQGVQAGSFRLFGQTHLLHLKNEMLKCA